MVIFMVRSTVCEFQAGATITLRHAEILQHKGLPDLKGKVDPAMIYVG